MLVIENFLGANALLRASMHALAGWGNWQRQCHTNSSANARVEAFPGKTDGMLVIQVCACVYMLCACVRP